MPRPETCARCGEEVRYGYRGGWGWFHREWGSDHAPVFGVAMTDEMWDKVREAMEGRKGGKVTKGEAVTVDENDDPDEEVFVPHVEVPWTQCDVSEVPGGAAQVANLAAKNGWDTAVWYARAHWKGKVISDMHRVEALASTGTKAVAWWRDGKFESSVVSSKTGLVKSPELKKLLKEEHS